MKHILAIVCGEHLHKGDKIHIEGKLCTRKWEDRAGNIHYTTEIIAREMEMLGGKKDSGNHAPNPDSEEPPLPEDVPF